MTLRRFIARGTAAALLAGTGGVLCANTASAAEFTASPAPSVAEFTARPAAAAPTKYRNCAQLNKAYPRGVGKKGAVDKTKGKRVTRFTVNNAVYARNAHLDRDRDGIACEKR